MVFTVKVAYNTEIVKVAKLTKIFGGNCMSGCAHVWSRRGSQLPYFYLQIHTQDFNCEARLMLGL